MCLLLCPLCRGKLQISTEANALTIALKAQPGTLERFDLRGVDRQVADLLLQGLRYREIAKKLGTSEQRIKNIVSKRIYNKVGCDNQAEFFSIVLTGKGAME
jgi:DNA-binding NarL/FixJ family response regulator